MADLGGHIIVSPLTVEGRGWVRRPSRLPTPAFDGYRTRARATRERKKRKEKRKCMSGRYDLRWFLGKKLFFFFLFCMSLCGDKIYDIG
jgi:hypothetical protein